MPGPRVDNKILVVERIKPLMMKPEWVDGVKEKKHLRNSTLPLGSERSSLPKRDSGLALFLQGRYPIMSTFRICTFDLSPGSEMLKVS